MNFKDLLKKYWFVGIVAIAFIVFICIYISDEKKNAAVVVPSRQVDGKYVALSVDGEDIFADDLYDEYYTTNGMSVEFNKFKNSVVDKFIETTDEISNQAVNYANNMYSYYMSYYGSAYFEQLIKNSGYVNGIDDLNQLCVDQIKSTKLFTDYLVENWDTYCKAYAEENNSRITSHILISVADISESTDADGNTIYTANPTEEEQTKLDEALKALETDDFETVAYNYSDDGSASQGGYIGLTETNSSMYPIYLKTALNLKDGEVSEVVTSQAGFHIIKNLGSDKQTLASDSDFLSAIEDLNTNLYLKVIMEKANEVGYKITDQTLLDEINRELGEGE